jgi:hypothetical protein
LVFSEPEVRSRSSAPAAFNNTASTHLEDQKIQIARS